jgi:hypothetical protein
MDNELREKIGKMLRDDRLPKECKNGIKCAICESSAKPVYMHLIEYSQNGRESYPFGFVPMSSHQFPVPGEQERIRGSFPICTSCAHQCADCGQSSLTFKVIKYFYNLNKKITYNTNFSENKPILKYGIGGCPHIHFRPFFALYILYRHIVKKLIYK